MDLEERRRKDRERQRKWRRRGKVVRAASEVMRRVNRDPKVIDFRIAKVRRVKEIGASVRMDDEPGMLKLVAELGPLSLDEVGALLGVGKQRIHQIEAQGMTKLRPVKGRENRYYDHLDSLYSRLLTLYVASQRLSLSADGYREMDMIVDALDALEGGLFALHAHRQQRGGSTWDESGDREEAV